MGYLPSVGVTAAAVVIEAGILTALYVVVRKSSSRMEALATEVKTKIMPIADIGRAMLVELKPKIDTIMANVRETTSVMRGQIERLDAAARDVVDTTRLQANRTEELLNRTRDRIDETSDLIHRTVVSPLRRLSGLVHGATASLKLLLGAKPRRP